MNFPNRLSLLFVLYITVIEAQSEFYTAAVVDYEPYFNSSEEPNYILQKNIDKYINFIESAKKQNADIIVFPEDGISYFNYKETPSEMLPYSNLIPNPELKISPCNNNTGEWTSLLKTLSCTAKENEIYVVVNLVENFPDNATKDTSQNSFLLYNTNVVFDRSGAVIARYRKYNLYLEEWFNITKTPELVSFTTDFGVTFGTFICFDILFGQTSVQLLLQNSSITDIVYSAAWFSDLPFLSAVPLQAAFARSYGVNLLASGYNYPAIGNGGSGIYSADGDITYITPVAHESNLLVAKVPKIKSRRNDRVINTANIIRYESQGKLEEMYSTTEILTNYTTELINSTLVDHKLCHDSFCCTFNVAFLAQENPEYYYRLVVYSGPRIFVSVETEVQICGLVSCVDQQLKSCGSNLHTSSNKNPIQFDNISIIGHSFINNNYSVYLPSVTYYDLSTTSIYKYQTTDLGDSKKIEMQTVVAEKQLLNFGIYTMVGNDGFINIGVLPLILVSVIMVLANYK